MTARRPSSPFSRRRLRDANARTDQGLRTLLIEMPFKSIDRPSLGLSLLKSSLIRTDRSCAIRYVNLQFAASMGLERYRIIAEQLPPDRLIGDLIFSHLLGSSPVDSLRSMSEQNASIDDQMEGLPEWLPTNLRHFQRLAGQLTAELAREVADSEFEVIGLSLMFQAVPSLALARAIKRLAPEKLIILGGAHCQGDMGLAFHEAHPWVDFVGRGEGDRLLPELLDRLETSRDFETDPIAGLVWRRQDGTSKAHREEADKTQDLDSLPAPYYDDWLVQLKLWCPDLDPGSLWLPLETSRGCWWGEKKHCIFCGLNGESLAFRHKSEKQVHREIGHLARYGIDKIYATDLIFPHRYFKTFLPDLAERSLGLRFFYETKANLSRQHLELLARAGVDRLQPGIESLSSPILEHMRKGVKAVQNIRLLKWAAELGISLKWNLLYGFPREDPAEYSRMADLIPLLSHLQPPTFGCYPVRIDRFSPLHFDHLAFGLGELRPASAYRQVYDLDEKTLQRLAYHFESSAFDERPEPVSDRSYVEPVIREVSSWRQSVGKATFLCLDFGSRLLLLDRRPIAKVQHVWLDGTDRDLFLACEAGVTRRQLQKHFGLDGASQDIRWIDTKLQRFVEHGWVIHLDHQFLSLPVSMDDFGGLCSESSPVQWIAAVGHASFSKRAMAKWKMA